MSPAVAGHTMRAMRIAWAVLVSMLVLVAAGCGSEDLGAGEANGAELLRAGALVYWETDSDPDSDQWKQVEELLGRFPDGEKWIAELKKELQTEDDVSWEGDVKPALGDQTVLAVYAKSLVDISFVGMTNSKDPDKAIALVKKLNASNPGDDVITRVVGDWVVISDKAASIDAALKVDGGQALADADGFKSAMEELPDDALSRVYFDPAGAVDAFGDADPETAKALRMFGLDKLDFAGAWAKARDDGAEIAGAVRGEGADKLLGSGESYKSKFLDRVPADAFAFYSIRGEGATKQFEALRDNPLYGMAFRQAEAELGIKIDQIIALFKGEVAFYAAPGSPIPKLTLMLESDDPQQGRQSADRLLRTLAQRGGGKVTEEGGVTTASFVGFTVSLGSLEDALVLTTSRGAIEELGGSGDKLADSDRFKKALEAADTPDEYTGLLYTDLGEAVELALGWAGAAQENVPPEVSRNLKPLRSLVVYGKQDGNLATSLAFLEIE
jgi:uncharacterized protein DUF3352